MAEKIIRDPVHDVIAFRVERPTDDLLFRLLNAAEFQRLRRIRQLGMHETGYTPNVGECSRLLRGVHDEGPCTDTQPTTGSSGLYSTSIDMPTAPIKRSRLTM